MVPPKIISPEFLLWSQIVLLWSTASYGITADPLQGEAANLRWARWLTVLICRSTVMFGISYAFSRSLILSGLLLLASVLQPLLRYRFGMRWLAEFEVCCIALVLASSLAVIRYFHLVTDWAPSSVVPAHFSALCLLASTLCVVVRGGTYVVRGILTKSGTVRSKEPVHASAKAAAGSQLPPAEERAPIAIAASTEELTPIAVDVEEYNRGRLIGNLERILLTIVVAAGSYAALAFLVAAKGVVRSEEFEKSREFAEYFLIGSLASVLVALCAGIILRFALIHLWPDLLTLQMQ